VATESADELRSALGTWLDEHLSPEVVAIGRGMPTDDSIDTLRDWNRELADAGWAAPAWPAAHGGRDAGIDNQIAYLEVMDEREAPGPVNTIGVANIAPAIMHYGTDEQKERYLRPLLRGDEIWSQGMSEPDAGSDLAALRTTAVPDGDGFVVNGQKTWNSLGHYADWCQLYVRTDPTSSKHKGLSCLLVDLQSDGIVERPIKTIAGAESFSELFFADVHVPRSALLGPQDQGWTVAMTTLSFERAGVARLHLGLSRRLAEVLAAPGVKAALSDPRLRQRVAAVHSDIACMRWMTNRSLAQIREGQPSGPSGSLAKLAWGRADQRLAALAIDLLGADGMLDGPWPTNLASSRQTTIAGGTTEINLNIVGEHGLGLPREPKPH
jgi:alkylation response protein AidB-like acyl-CoA dehydrogenase